MGTFEAEELDFTNDLTAGVKPVLVYTKLTIYIMNGMSLYCFFL